MEHTADGVLFRPLTSVFPPTRPERVFASLGYSGRANGCCAASPGGSIEDGPLVATALDWAEGGMDFADALHLAAASGCERFLSFDRRLARAAVRVDAVAVAAP